MIVVGVVVVVSVVVVVILVGAVIPLLVGISEFVDMVLREWFLEFLVVGLVRVGRIWVVGEFGLVCW